MKSDAEYVQGLLSQLIRDTRDLYRTDLTLGEAEDGWCDIISFEMKHGDALGEWQKTSLDSTKLEFSYRMDYMGLQYINFTKAMKVIEGMSKCP